MSRVLVVLLLLAGSVAADSRLAPIDIRFEFGKAVIKRDSYAQLDAVAATLRSESSIKLVEVQAHTDERGNDKYNLEMSQRRAEAVRDYLIKKGIAATRL